MIIMCKDNTIRVEIGDKQYAWPSYMDCPLEITSTFIIHVTKMLKAIPIDIGFDNSTGIVVAGKVKLKPSNLINEVWKDTDITFESTEVQAFCNAVWTDKYKRIFQIKTERGLI